MGGYGEFGQDRFELLAAGVLTPLQHLLQQSGLRHTVSRTRSEQLCTHRDMYSAFKHTTKQAIHCVTRASETKRHHKLVHRFMSTVATCGVIKWSGGMV